MRVYVAGAYSADNVITVLDNMRRGMRASTEVFLRGHAPFCPWLDYQFQLMLREGEALTVEDYYRYSMAWLEVADLVYVIPGWAGSKGTVEEIRRAHELQIPVVYDLREIEEAHEPTDGAKTVDDVEGSDSSPRIVHCPKGGKTTVGYCFTSCLNPCDEVKQWRR